MLFRSNPIIVNAENFVVDGQHRFVACKMLKLPVYFVVAPSVSLRQIAEINNNQSRWRARDYMHCYIDANVNKSDYQSLSEFIDKHKISVSLAVGLLMYGKVGGGGQTDAFRDGQFKANYIDSAERIMSLAKDYEQFGADYKSRAFLQAIDKLSASEGYVHEKVIARLKKHELTVEQCGSFKEYLRHIEELYNYRVSNRQVI